MAPYFLQNLVPRKENAVSRKSIFRAVADTTWVQWALVFSGWLSWTCDAMDFFSVSLAVPLLTKPGPLGFNRNTHKITTAITLTLLFRSVGAVIFGIASDRYGRKWPLVVNLLLCCVLQIGASFCVTFRQFLGVRSIFGIAMGGIWGLATATALESVPVELRGIISGVMQQGYAVGYLIAAVVNLTLVAHSRHTWRTLFWVSAGITFAAAILRAVLPESQVFLRAKADRDEKEANGLITESRTRTFLREVGKMLKIYWPRCIYAVFLMSGFNFLSHGSQDLYPTYLQDDKKLSARLASKATIIGNCGAIVGGTFAGWVSQYIGRRLTIIIFCLTIGAFIPLWILPSAFPGLAAGAFFIQAGVQGAWGVIPIFLNEISPPAFRATFPGVVYQLGNMVSSASAQIEAVGGQHQRTIVKGQDVPDYAKVQGIFIGVVAAFIVIVISFGPENHGSHFEKYRTAFEEGGADSVDSGISPDGSLGEKGDEKAHA